MEGSARKLLAIQSKITLNEPGNTLLMYQNTSRLVALRNGSNSSFEQNVRLTPCPQE